MKEGKMSNDLLEDSILSHLIHEREDILIGPGVGEDCAAIAFGDLVCTLTTDPITGATKDIGKIAVHISCNDIASSGLMPIALLITILLPLSSTSEDAKKIMLQAQETASGMNVAIIGGHTEFTSAVNRPVLSVTAIGKGDKTQLTATKGAQVGDAIVMSKWAGLEGTAIIANEKWDELLEKGMEEEALISSVNLLESLSVVPEGQVASRHKVHAMHDVTEGGIYGAVWEMCQASGKGARLIQKEIPLLKETAEICELFSLNPYRLISSGSMLMTMEEGDYQAAKMEAESKGILLTKIGRITDGETVKVELSDGEEELAPPDVDELYQVFQ